MHRSNMTYICLNAVTCNICKHGTVLPTRMQNKSIHQTNTFATVYAITLETWWTFAAFSFFILQNSKYQFCTAQSSHKQTANKTSMRSDLTEQAEKDFPFLVSFQQPPLLIWHLPTPEAAEKNILSISRPMRTVLVQ